MKDSVCLSVLQCKCPHSIRFFFHLSLKLSFETAHEKPTKSPVRTGKTQTGLGIGPVCISVFTVCMIKPRVLIAGDFYNSLNLQITYE